MTDSPRTTVHIAPYLQPDGHTVPRMTLEFKDHIYEAQAIARARAIIRAKSLGHTERGYLLNCLDIGNYIFGDLPAPTTPRNAAPIQPTSAKAQPHIPSRNAADTPDGAVIAALKPTPQYTGSAIIGIATMHKSNLVPIFNAEAAVDAATMRRG